MLFGLWRFLDISLVNLYQDENLRLFGKKVIPFSYHEDLCLWGNDTISCLFLSQDIPLLLAHNKEE